MNLRLILLCGALGAAVAVRAGEDAKKAPGTFVAGTPAEIAAYMSRELTPKGYSVTAKEDKIVVERPLEKANGVQFFERDTFSLYPQKDGTLVLGKLERVSRGLFGRAADETASAPASFQKWLDAMAREIPIERGGATGMALRGDPPVVVGLAAGGPAEAAGARKGDVILRVDGHPVAKMLDARRLLVGPIGSPVEVTVDRGGEERKMTITRVSYEEMQKDMASRPAAAPPTGSPPN